VTVHCCDATASSFIVKGGEVFEHFYAVAVKRHSSMRNWLFGLPGRILCDVKENDEHAFDFALHLTRISRSNLNWACHSNNRIRLMISSLTACLIVERVSVALLQDLQKKLMLFLCGIHREIASGHHHTTTNKIKSARAPSCVKFCTLTPTIR
jgi:hypothetical protein